jgi:glycosyltransferase involved in cell wall biosynthesis
MATPLVSVLMTAYNREKYIAEAIESVLASTFKDFELIIIDDCSKDHTVEIARRYTADPRVQVHVNEKNLGDYPNRNRAAGYAKGKYLKYVDADDYIYPHGLSVILDMMEKFPNAGLGFASLEQDVKRPFPFQLSPREAYLRHYFDRPIFHKAPLSVIIRKDAFQAVGGFTGKRMVGDFEMWHILATRYPVVLMPEGIVWYREHSAQEMRDYYMDVRQRFAYSVIAYEQLLKPECPLSAVEKTIALSQVKRSQARSILRAMAKGQARCAREMLRTSNLKAGELLSVALAQSPKR